MFARPEDGAWGGMREIDTFRRNPLSIRVFLLLGNLSRRRDTPGLTGGTLESWTDPAIGHRSAHQDREGTLLPIARHIRSS